MAALTEGYIYFIESEAAQQNWLTNPHAIVIGNFTEGTHYCKIELPQQHQKSFVTGIFITDSGAGTSYDYRSNRYSYTLQGRGLVTSKANAALVDKFVMNARHTASATASYFEYYMIIKYATADADTSYEMFTDNAGTQRRYCKGAILNGNFTWNQINPLNMQVVLNFKSKWG